MIIEDKDLLRNNNNIDSLRLIASSFVLIGHSGPVLLNEPLEWDPFLKLFGIPIHQLGVLIFFVISGFLVTHSWYARKNIFDFVTARVLRIFPAVIILVLLSVFVLGTSLTTCSLHDYLSSGTTANYLQNMTLYRMYYYLPGVFFETNPIGGSINGSLWTLPYEFTCYIFLIIIAALTILKNKWAYLSFLITLTGTYLLFEVPIDKIVIPIIGIDFKHFYSLFLYFLSGSVYYHYRRSISFGIKGWLLDIVAIVLIHMQYLPQLMYVFILPHFVFLYSFSKKINLRNIGKYGDFSYGLYLYAFPIQQLIVYFMPVKINVLIMIGLSFLFTFPFAMLSWIFIEKPALKLRQKIHQFIS